MVSLGILFGLIAMLGYGISNAIAQVPAKRIGPTKTIFYRNALVSLFLFVTLLFFLNSATFSLFYILIALVISLIGYLPLMTFYKGLRVGKVGLVAPVANSSVLFTVLLSLIFFGEVLSLWQGIAILLIVVGIILISLDFNDLKNSQLFSITSGIPYALITCFLWGVVFFLLKFPTNVLGPILTSLLLEGGIMIYSGAHLAVAKEGYALEKKTILWHLLAVAIFGAMGTLFFTLGIKAYNVSIVAALTFANPVVSALYGTLVYKERLNLQQYGAIVLIGVGIVVLSYL